MFAQGDASGSRADEAAGDSKPAVTQAGCADGEKDAEELHRPLTYTLAGVVGGPVTLYLAMRSAPSPPESKLAALAADGRQEYARCYGLRARRKNIKAAANGFAIAVFTGLTINFMAASRTAP